MSQRLVVDCNRISELVSQRSVVGESLEGLSLARWSVVADRQVGGGPVSESLIDGQWVGGEPVDGLVVGCVGVPALKQALSLIDRIFSHELSKTHNFD